MTQKWSITGNLLQLQFLGSGEATFAGMRSLDGQDESSTSARSCYDSNLTFNGKALSDPGGLAKNKNNKFAWSETCKFYLFVKFDYLSSLALSSQKCLHNRDSSFNSAWLGIS